ncbi:unnamed protein product [Trichogramma brassicae]|uniref:Uncharacterized protein n=1 Tax=Trichogramma brassicae TaxID=86971 RepID=A0A6H5ICU4_9HYME|nr:unnamed protein product [Trichogramma brassicae]
MFITRLAKKCRASATKRRRSALDRCGPGATLSGEGGSVVPAPRVPSVQVLEALSEAPSERDVHRQS